MLKPKRGGKSANAMGLKEAKVAVKPQEQPKPFKESVMGLATDKDLQIYVDDLAQGTVVEIIGTLPGGNEMSFWQSKILKGTEDDLESVKRMYSRAQEDFKYYKDIGYRGVR